MDRDKIIEILQKYNTSVTYDGYGCISEDCIEEIANELVNNEVAVRCCCNCKNNLQPKCDGCTDYNYWDKLIDS